MKNFCFSIFLSLRSEGKGRIIKEQKYLPTQETTISVKMKL